MNTDITIEKGVPIPLEAYRPRRLTVYPIEALGIGDSFVVDKPKKTVQTSVMAINSHKKLGFRFAFWEEAKGYTRVWRTE